MEKILIYIVLAAIYYGFKFFMKNFKGQSNEESENRPPVLKPQQVPEKRGGATPWSQEPAKTNPIFDLLEEIKKKENDGKAFREQPYQDLRSLETENYESNITTASGEKPYIEYQSIDMGEYSKESSKFKEFDDAPRKEHPIKKALKNAQRTREAFVISEVLQKKY